MATQTYPRVIPGCPAKNVVIALFLIMFAVVSLTKASQDTQFSVFFFGLSAVLAAIGVVPVYQAIRSLPTLTLTEEGFEISTGLVKRRFPWAEYYGFRVGIFIGPTVIYFRRKGNSRPQALINQFAVSSSDLSATLSQWQTTYGHVVPAA